MRGDVMKWVGRMVAMVFGLGVLALIGALAVLIGRSDGVPPLPVFGGLLALVMLILLAGACLALISLAVSARRALRLLEQDAPEAVPKDEAEPAPMQGPPFSPTGLAEVAAPRPARPGRVLVAER